MAAGSPRWAARTKSCTSTRGGNLPEGSMPLVAMNPPPPITVVGGGLAGLVAAITAAEAGAVVDLHEAHPMLGGRARSTQGPYVANLGPHVVYCDGPLWAWLDERRLTRPFRKPPMHGLRFRHGGRIHRTPPAGMVTGTLRLLRAGDAPVDRSFGAWAREVAGEQAAAALSAFAGVVTFSSDPGSWSAAFVWDRVRRALAVPPAARYIVGGWGQLVGRLEHRARDLGVTVHLGSRLDALPAGPTIVATELATARRLLDDETLRWPSGRTVLLDLGLRGRRGDPFVVSDLTSAAGSSASAP